MSKENTNGVTSYKSTKGEGRSSRNKDSSTSLSKPSSNLSATSGGPNSQKVDNEDDDDFNPRGSSASANASSNYVDLFGPSLMDDLVDTTAMPSVGIAHMPEVDLFANTAFQSANAPLETASGSHAQGSIDLFAGRSSFTGSATSDTEFTVRGSPSKSSEHNPSSPALPSASAFDPFQPSFAASFPSDTEFSVRDTPNKSLQEKTPTHQHSSATDIDPFPAVSIKSFDGSYSFGAFSSNVGSGLAESRHDPLGGVKSSDRSPLEELNFGAFTSYTESPAASGIKPTNKFPTKLDPDSMSTSKPDVKKGAFQVKSSIWADSLSRGLIDLNITAPKKVDLSDVGVVGQLSDGFEEKGRAAPWYMGTTMGMESGLGKSGFPSSTGAASGSGNFQQQQFGNFK
uniref:Clathrin interactor EPSIN 1 n=1 Tax=Arundo donax TaxID=35708 RepID=A0A0A9H847_ARUDO